MIKMKAKKEFLMLDDKVVIITGANTGIGYTAALDLAKRNSTVILACRDRTRAKNALDKIIEESGNDKIFIEELELGDLTSVRNFAQRFNEKYGRLDLLINNAGIMMCPYGKTKDGFETQFGVNHLGHFLLTNLLLDLLKKSAPSRIINVSAVAHKNGNIRWDDLNWEKTYKPFDAYAQSKLANVLFTVELAKRLKGTDVTAVSLHPGIVNTEISRNFTGIVGRLARCLNPCGSVLLKSPEEGAKTTIHCAVSPDIPTQSGCYFSDCRPQRLSAKATNAEDAAKLWDISAKMVKLEM